MLQGYRFRKNTGVISERLFRCVRAMGTGKPSNRPIFEGKMRYFWPLQVSNTEWHAACNVMWREMMMTGEHIDMNQSSSRTPRWLQCQSRPNMREALNDRSYRLQLPRG